MFPVTPVKNYCFPRNPKFLSLLMSFPIPREDFATYFFSETALPAHPPRQAA
jgi:hypothetical protein